MLGRQCKQNYSSNGLRPLDQGRINNTCSQKKVYKITRHYTLLIQKTDSLQKTLHKDQIASKSEQITEIALRMSI